MACYFTKQRQLLPNFSSYLQLHCSDKLEWVHILFPLAAGAVPLGTQPLSFDTSSFNQLIRHWLGKLSHHLRLQELDN